MSFTGAGQWAWGAGKRTASGMWRAAGSINASMKNSYAGRAFRAGVGETMGFEYTRRGTRFVNQGWLGIRGAGGIRNVGAGGLALRALGPAFMAMSAYQGYQRNGIIGAATNVATDAAIWGGIRAGWALGVNPVTGFLAGTAAVGYGTYKFGEAAQDFTKRLRKTEMGGGNIDMFGTAATMRQRSLSMIQNTHVNGRIGLGNEGALFHTRRFR